MRHIDYRIFLLGGAAAFAAPLAHAQQASPTPAPTPAIITPGIGNFSLRPSGQQSQPQPVQTVTPTPAPTPAPSPRATAPAARPIPQPAQRTVTPPTPVPRATSTPAPVVQATPTPAATVLPTPAAIAPAIVATPSSAPQPRPEGGTPWLWMLIGAALAAAIGTGGWLLGRRGPQVRRAEPETRPIERAAPPPPAPVPRAVPPGPPPVSEPVAPAPAEPIAIDFRPLSIEVSEKGAVLDFELGLQNLSGAQADGLKISLLLASANPDQDALIASFHASSGLPPAGPPVDLPAGEGGRIPGKLTIEADRIHVVHVGGRPMFVPILLVELRWRGGLSIRRHGADFMLGTAGQSGGQGGKLGPIWLDRGAQRMMGLAATRYLPQARPVAA